jgi:hypothetical protein
MDMLEMQQVARRLAMLAAGLLAVALLPMALILLFGSYADPGYSGLWLAPLALATGLVAAGYWLMSLRDKPGTADPGESPASPRFYELALRCAKWVTLVGTAWLAAVIVAAYIGPLQAPPDTYDCCAAQTLWGFFAVEVGVAILAVNWLVYFGLRGQAKRRDG